MSNFLYRSHHDAAKLAHYLQDGRDFTLRRRRQVIGLSLLSAGMMGTITLFQTGLVKAPRPPTRWLDGSIVNGSPHAYRIGSAPDGTLGLLSYGVTLLLAAMGGRDRARTHPWIPLVLAGKAAADAANAAKLMYLQPTKYKAFCVFCVTASLATFAALPLTFGEAREAISTLFGRPAPARSAARQAFRHVRHAVA